MKRLLVLPLLLLGLGGCPSLSTLQTPRTVPPGDLRVAVGAEAVGVPTSEGTLTAPQIELGLRYGLSESWDIGAKLYGLGAEFGAKYQFLRGDFDAALAPAFSFIAFSTKNDTGDKVSAQVFYLHVPLLFGANLNDSVTVAFGPKFLYALVNATGTSSTTSQSATASGAMMGGYLGLPLRLGRAFWLAPEINLYKPFSSSGVLWQGGLAFLFGGAPR
jgi:hypothetical protein